MTIKEYFDSSDTEKNLFQSHDRLSNQRKAEILNSFKDINTWVSTNYLDKVSSSCFPVWPDISVNNTQPIYQITSDQVFNFMIHLIKDNLLHIKHLKTNISLQKRLYYEIGINKININRLMKLVIIFFAANHSITKGSHLPEVSELPSYIKKLVPSFEPIQCWKSNSNVLIVRMAPISKIQTLMSKLCPHDFTIEIITQASSKEEVQSLHTFNKVHIIPDGFFDLQKALAMLKSSQLDESYDNCIIVINNIQSDNFHEITQLIYSSVRIRNWFVYTGTHGDLNELMRISDA